MSLAFKGTLYRNLNEDELRRRITIILMGRKELDGIAGTPPHSEPVQG